MITLLRRCFITATILSASLNQTMAATINIPQQLTEGLNKGKYIEAQSGFDGSKKAAYMQADMTFVQVCSSRATIGDLQRISKTTSFNELYERLKSGRVVGLSESKQILVKDKKSYCKGES